jgi:hypothetical protein
MEWLGIGMVIALTALWLIARRLTTVTLVLVSLAAGALAMIVLNRWLALPIAILTCEICAMTALARLAVSIAIWPLAVWGVWYEIRIALDGWWAFGLAMLAAWAVGSVLVRFVVSPHCPPHRWLKRRFS